MLKLLIFAPCEKVIVGQGGQVSAIGIIETIQTQMETDAELPADALTQFRWGFLTLWSRDEDIDSPIHYESEIRIFRPDGADAGFRARAEFDVSMEFKNFRQQNDDIAVFPIGQEGRYELKLYLRRAGEEQWEERATFPVIVQHLKRSSDAQNIEQNT